LSSNDYLSLHLTQHKLMLQHYLGKSKHMKSALKWTNNVKNYPWHYW